MASARAVNASYLLQGSKLASFFKNLLLFFNLWYKGKEHRGDGGAD